MIWLKSGRILGKKRPLIHVSKKNIFKQSDAITICKRYPLLFLKHTHPLWLQNFIVFTVFLKIVKQWLWCRVLLICKNKKSYRPAGFIISWTFSVTWLSIKLQNSKITPQQMRCCAVLCIFNNSAWTRSPLVVGYPDEDDTVWQMYCLIMAKNSFIKIHSFTQAKAIELSLLGFLDLSPKKVYYHPPCFEPKFHQNTK